MIGFILAVLFVAIGTLAYVALRNAQDFSDANQVIPGVATHAPKAWAGAHSLEARLHRRLRDAMEAVRANTALDDPSLIDVRHQLEQQALATDDRLVAAAALPKGQREPQLEAVAQTVDAIEATVGSMIALRGPEVTEVQAELDAIRTRVRLIAEARSELAGLEPGTTSDLDRLRAQLEAGADESQTGAAVTPPPEPPSPPPPTAIPDDEPDDPHST